MMFSVLFQKQSEMRQRRERMQFLVTTLQNYSRTLFDRE